jgi:peptidoglycan DL-endopeptidase CwlO
VVILTSLLVLLSCPGPAGADAVSAKKREAARLAASIDALGDKLSALAEDENDANLQLARLSAKTKAAEAELARTDSRAAKLELRARQAALDAVADPFGGAGIALEGSSAVDQFERARVLTDRARDRDRDVIDEVRASREDINRKRAAVTSARRAAASLSASLAKKRKSTDRLLTRYEALQRQADGELKVLVAQAERDRIAAEARRARQELATRQAEARRALAIRQAEAARSSASSRADALKRKADAEKRLAALRRNGSGATRQEIAAAREAAAEAETAARTARQSSKTAQELAQLQIDAGAGSESPASPGARSAVQVALGQLGKPYVWGASGPGGFDCSGLVLYAWRSAGKSLPHSSRAQYAATTRVSVSQIQVGDLVFYGSPIHHVGMYIGNGNMVEASRRGTPVRTRSIFRRDLVGVGRVG